MRINRAKTVRKYLRFFRLAYLIEPPYNVLLDGNFVHNALKNKISIGHRLGKLLQEEKFKLFVLKSALDEIRSAGVKCEGTLSYCLKECTVLNDDDIKAESTFDKLVGYLGMVNIIYFHIIFCSY